MTKYEFIDRLRAALSISLNYNTVNENVRYYEDYIDTQIRQGRTEREVLEELGDPRLIAKTIIEANKAAAGAESVDMEDETVYHGEGRKKNSHVFRIPGWLLWIVLILVVFLIFSMVTSIISFVFPVLFPVLLILFLIKLFTSRNG